MADEFPPVKRELEVTGSDIHTGQGKAPEAGILG